MRRRWMFGFAAGVGLAVLVSLLVWFLVPPRREAPRTASRDVAAPAEAGTLDFISCWFAVPEGRHARCGVLTVPENWGAPHSRSLHLRLVIFQGAVGGAADPVIYLPGGPGEPAGIDRDGIARWWALIDRTDWLRQRDLVVFDPRGAGLSEPSMNCPEIADTAYRVFAEPLAPAAADEQWADAARRCYRRLAQSGIDLASYTTRSNVEDLHSLVSRLNYRSWNILAASYGTRVALRSLDRGHDGTRAVILDSVYPPAVAAYVEDGLAASDAFAALFRECDQDRACHSAYPDIAQTFEKLVRRAAEAPIIIDIPDPRGGPALRARLDDGKLVDVLLYAFYDWRHIGQLPSIIAALAKGEPQALTELARDALDNYVSPRLSHGLYLSIECHDEFPFNRRDEVEHAAQSLPLFRRFALTALPLAACPAWPVGQAGETDRHPATSEVPVLLLSGELDPVTPPRWAKRAASHLRRGFPIEFRGAGHGVLAAHDCASLLAGAFLAEPTRAPYADCLLAVGPPQFRVR